MKLTLTHKGPIPPEHCVSGRQYLVQLDYTDLRLVYVTLSPGGRWWITDGDFFDECMSAVIAWEPIESINVEEEIKDE